MSSRLTPARVSPLAAAGVSDYILNLLTTLHAESLEQESKIDKKVYADPTGVHAATVDKFIALDADKAEYVYSLLRATGATNVVEAGTSFGVSTIYLALAVAANAKAKGVTGRVIATEHERTKAERARGYWRNCGKMVEDVIELREGDLRQTLTKDLGTVDFLLLDIWTPMALPTLKIVQPHLRPGAVIVADNTIASAAGYADLLSYIRAENSGFVTMTLPFDKGLEMIVYLGPRT